MVVKVIQFYTFILFGKKYRKKYRKNIYFLGKSIAKSIAKIYTFWEKVSQKYILFGKKYNNHITIIFIFFG
jgi:hypothetical protein